MYGTVARVLIKRGMEQRLLELSREFEAAHVPRFIGEYVYRVDNEPDVYYMAAVFESREAYIANANDPAQHARYLQLRELLEDEPEWHDGEIVYAYPTS